MEDNGGDLGLRFGEKSNKKRNLWALVPNSTHTRVNLRFMVGNLEILHKN